MKSLRALLRALAVARRGELVYSADYDRKCQIPLPGDFDRKTIMQPGDQLRVYVIRAAR